MATFSLVKENNGVIRKAKAFDYGIFNKAETTNFGTVKITETLPFRIKFINVGIGGYGPNNPPPIGIAIIGVNNYIL